MGYFDRVFVVLGCCLLGDSLNDTVLNDELGNGININTMQISMPHLFRFYLAVEP
jgi:hypothetical protein